MFLSILLCFIQYFNERIRYFSSQCQNRRNERSELLLLWERRSIKLLQFNCFETELASFMDAAIRETSLAPGWPIACNTGFPNDGACAFDTLCHPCSFRHSFSRISLISFVSDFALISHPFLSFLSLVWPPKSEIWLNWTHVLLSSYPSPSLSCTWTQAWNERTVELKSLKSQFFTWENLHYWS